MPGYPSQICCPPGLCGYCDAGETPNPNISVEIQGTVDEHCTGCSSEYDGTYLVRRNPTGTGCSYDRSFSTNPQWIFSGSCTDAANPYLLILVDILTGPVYEITITNKHTISTSGSEHKFIATGSGTDCCSDIQAPLSASYDSRRLINDSTYPCDLTTASVWISC